MPRLASSILGGVIMKTHDTCPRTCSLENYLALPDYAPNGGIAERIAQACPRLGATTLLLGHRV
jgi:hypothetical protein